MSQVFHLCIVHLGTADSSYSESGNCNTAKVIVLHHDACLPCEDLSRPSDMDFHCTDGRALTVAQSAVGMIWGFVMSDCYEMYRTTGYSRCYTRAVVSSHLISGFPVMEVTAWTLGLVTGMRTGFYGTWGLSGAFVCESE